MLANGHLWSRWLMVSRPAALEVCESTPYSPKKQHFARWSLPLKFSIFWLTSHRPKNSLQLAVGEGNIANSLATPFHENPLQEEKPRIQ